ncbi:DUF6588 family protein [Plebeiibacterium marinum]|uniref:Outer membrane protein beta-barrel domain-containing protein n=1 Tax=Plebeiibacterium marinum TaxID=2992111 RepID=A0AAE3SI84_9BACT|nr:DUF6588 family protein [Plebeiobacterium marinum]MCW3804188.1 hypothetical protein [Plebeiobacterium marinum]
MKKIIIALILCMSSVSMFSQFNIGSIFEAGMHDAKALADPYLKPYGEMLGTSLNTGWYTSAKTHKLLGFDITFTGSYTKAPSSAKTFDVNDVNLESFSLSPNSQTSIAPTLAGKSSERPILRHNDDITPGGVSDFTLPNGSGTDYMPLPMVTVGVGLPYGLEIKGRFSPELKYGDVGKLSLWGLGVQKEVKDYIPGIKHVPFLNMSVLAAYTNFSGSASMNNVTDVVTDGEIEIGASAYTTRLLVGANFPVIAFFVGAGYGNASSDFDISGEFANSEMEPFTLSYSTGALDFNAGLRIRLGVIGLHADYTVGDYSAITAGIGINFR